MKLRRFRYLKEVVDEIFMMPKWGRHRAGLAA
jgi:hypothetical protein